MSEKMTRPADADLVVLLRCVFVNLILEGRNRPFNKIIRRFPVPAPVMVLFIIRFSKRKISDFAGRGKRLRAGRLQFFVCLVCVDGRVGISVVPTRKKPAGRRAGAGIRFLPESVFEIVWHIGGIGTGGIYESLDDPVLDCKCDMFVFLSVDHVICSFVEAPPAFVVLEFDKAVRGLVPSVFGVHEIIPLDLGERIADLDSSLDVIGQDAEVRVYAYDTFQQLAVEVDGYDDLLVVVIHQDGVVHPFFNLVGRSEDRFNLVLSYFVEGLYIPLCPCLHAEKRQDQGNNNSFHGLIRI